MARNDLFVSFWDVTLENLPKGTFQHQELSPKQAQKLIAAVRKAKRLRGCSGDDLFAPHQEHQRKNHDALRAVLEKHYGIKLALKDFMLADEDPSLSTIFPLQLMHVGDGAQLLVVNCHYTLAPRQKKGKLKFDIATDSVTFHLFRAVSKPRRARR